MVLTCIKRSLCKRKPLGLIVLLVSSIQRSPLLQISNRVSDLLTPLCKLDTEADLCDIKWRLPCLTSILATCIKRSLSHSPRVTA